LRPTLYVLRSHFVGSTVLIANATTENELSTPAGEWTSDVFKPSTSDSTTACLLFDLKFGKIAKRMNVELTYRDVNDTIQKASLFDHNIGTKKQREQHGTFEFHLKDVLEYQVGIF